MNYKGPEKRKGATTSVRFTRDDVAFLDSMGKRSRNAAMSECLRVVKEAYGWRGEDGGDVGGVDGEGGAV